MRMPNGLGSIYKTSGSRRKKWRAVVTTGWSDDGKQIRKTIGYYTTKTEAMNVLQEYNSSPNGIDGNVTFEEVYNRLYKYKIDSLSDSSRKAYELAYKYCERLYCLKMVDIKADILFELMNDIRSKHGISRKVRTLLKQIFQYAIQNDIVSVNYAEFIEVKREKPKAAKHPFTVDEIDVLLDNCNVEDVDTILIMIFTGMRVGELLSLKKESINLEEKYIRCGSKTDAGTNRLVPISEKIFPLIKNRFEKANSEYLIEYNGTNYKYRTYRDRFDKVLSQFNMKHTPHECRHTFATLLDNAGANERAITKIMGHTNFKTTEKFYTHKEISDLKKAIDLI